MSQGFFDMSAGELRENLERTCPHTWGQTKYTPIDWRGPCYVPTETIKQWSRTCTKCGKTETTRATKKEWVAGY